MRKLLSFNYPFPDKGKWVNYLSRSFRICCIVFFVLVSTKSFTQTFPSPSSCTSKDLLLVKASVPYTACETCTPGTYITKPLTVAINNKTGSVRTSFAFWATLKILNADGSTDSSGSISGCFGPIPKNATTSFLYGNITYKCGKTLQLTNIWEAWTTSNSNETCAVLQANSATINPKCGVDTLLSIIAGVDANFTVTDATCTSSGSIKVKPYGGTAPYTVQLGTGTPRNVPAGDSTTFTSLTPGTYTFTLKDANNCTGGVIRTRTVLATGSVLPPTSGGDQTQCQQSPIQTLTATATVPSGITLTWWTASTGGTQVSNPTLNSVGTITYYAQASNGTCTSPGRTAVTLTINALTSAPSVTTPVVYCQNATASVLTATGTSLLWYTAATGGTGSSTAPTPSTTSAGNTSYWVSQTVTSNGVACESGRAQIVVTINATPSAPSVTTPVVYCQNATASALTATGTSLLWYAAATGGTGSSTAPTPSTTSAGNTSYWVSQTVTSNGVACEGSRTEIVVTINATTAAPSVTTPVVYCRNATASALTATGTSLLWYTTSTGGTGSSTAPTPSTTSAGNTSYWVSQTVTSNGLACEGSRAEIVVTINAATAAPSVTTPVVYCRNATASALTATGTNLLWYTAATGGTGSPTAPTPSTSSAGNTSYWVSQTVTSNGVACEGSRAEIVVTINATTAAPSVTTPVVYCRNATASALTATGTSLLWYTTSTGGTGSSTAPTPSTSLAGNTSYYVSQTVTTNGVACEGTRAQIVVTINENPTITISATPISINLTTGTTSQLGIASISPGVISDYDYSWIIIAKPVLSANASITNETTATPTLNILNPFIDGTYTVQVTATNKTTGCSNTATKNIEVPSQAPPSCKVTGPSTICPGTTNTFKYDPDENGIADAIPVNFTAAWTIINNTNNATFSGSSGNVNTVSVIAGSGCNSAYTVKITLTSSSGLITSNCEKDVTVIDNTPPVFANCPGDLILDFCSGSVPPPANVTATDNCSSTVTIVYSEIQSGSNCNINITRTWIATDACNNSNTCTQHITIKTKPLITCPPDKVLACGASTLPASTGTATAYSACSSLTITYVDALGSSVCGSAHNISRTWTATDLSGNTSSCVQQITFNESLTNANTTSNNSEFATRKNSSFIPAADLQVKAYPNPFNERVKFVVTAPQAGYGTLELVNMLGQKVKTVYSGYMPAGGQTLEMTLPARRTSSYFYIFRMGGKQVTGKLLQTAK